MKAGFIGLIGLPNAGKSTVTNLIVGEQVGIVSPKPQTTRQRVTGILTTEQSQLIFVDAPGLVYSDSGINHYLQEEFKDVVKGSDVLLAILNIDAKKPNQLEEIINICKTSGKPWLAFINKTDLPQKHRQYIIEDLLRKEGIEFFSGSCRRGVERWTNPLIQSLTAMLPENPGPLYETEIYTTQTLREMAREFIRESCFEFLHQEIPYGLAVDVEKFEEGSRVTKVYAALIVAKENHRSIVIGEKGQSIKRIGTHARQKLEKLLGQNTSGQKVYLELYVKVRKDWSKNSTLMEDLGYVIPKS